MCAGRGEEKASMNFGVGKWKYFLISRALIIVNRVPRVRLYIFLLLPVCASFVYGLFIMILLLSLSLLLLFFFSLSLSLLNLNASVHIQF